MRQIKSSSHINSHKIAFYFVLGIISLFFVSIIFRGVILVSKSKFDGSHRFTILISSSVPSQKKQTVVSLEPNTQTFSIINLPDGSGITPVSHFLEIPIDGKIQLTTTAQVKTLDGLLTLEGDMGGKDLSLVLGKFIFDYTRIKTDLTIMDLVHFAWFSKSVPKSQVKYVAISGSISESAIDRLSSSFFPDSELQKENVSIQIINATGVLGLGNRLARFITNMGGSVVSVSTSDALENDSKIVKRTKNTYTFNRLTSILRFKEGTAFVPSPTPVESLLLEDKDAIPENKNLSNSFVSDIMIVIGKHSLSSLVF